MWLGLWVDIDIYNRGRVICTARSQMDAVMAHHARRAFAALSGVSVALVRHIVDDKVEKPWVGKRGLYMGRSPAKIMEMKGD